MKFSALLKRVEGLAEILSEPLEALPEDIEVRLSTFLWISSGVEFEPNEIEWQPACGLDDESVITAKFLRYMDSDSKAGNRAVELLNERDRPYDAELAPQEDTGDQGKKK